MISMPWYVRCKPYIYVTQALTLSPNGLEQYSTGPTSLASSIGRIQNYFISLWYVECKPCTYLVSRLALPDHRHLGVPSGASKTDYEPMVRLTQTEHLSCTDTNTVSKQIET
jgi:hypothetical protein